MNRIDFNRILEPMLRRRLDVSKRLLQGIWTNRSSISRPKTYSHNGYCYTENTTVQYYMDRGWYSGELVYTKDLGWFVEFASSIEQIEDWNRVRPNDILTAFE